MVGVLPTPAIFQPAVKSVDLRPMKPPERGAGKDPRQISPSEARRTAQRQPWTGTVSGQTRPATMRTSRTLYAFVETIKWPSRSLYGFTHTCSCGFSLGIWAHQDSNLEPRDSRDPGISPRRGLSLRPQFSL